VLVLFSVAGSGNATHEPKEANPRAGRRKAMLLLGMLLAWLVRCSSHQQ